MAKKIMLGQVDPTMTVGQLLSAYRPLGYDVFLLLENRPSILDSLLGKSPTPVREPELVELPISLPQHATEEDEQRALEELDVEVRVNGEVVGGGQDSNLEATPISPPTGAPSATPSSTTPGACADPTCPVLHDDPSDPIHPPSDLSEDSPTCGNRECSNRVGDGKKYCCNRCRSREATLVRKERGRPEGGGRGQVRSTGEPVDVGPCPCGCGRRVLNQPHGRQRKWATDECRRRGYSTTPVLERTVTDEPPAPDGPPPGTPAPAVERPKVCGRCDQEGHWVIECPYKSQAAARKALGTAPQTTGKKKAAPVDPRPKPERPEAQERVHVPAVIDITDDEVLGKRAMELRERWAEGFPGKYSFLPDVLALYGVTEEIVESALRAPERVEVRPESFDKEKRYTVLGFFRGDVSVILGLRDVHNPCVIAVYVGSMLEHDTHRVGHTGGGGSKREAGVPTTPAKVAQRLRGLGAKVAVDSREDTAEVVYLGQVLGKIQTGSNTPRLTCQADFQRMQRKMHAIDRRETASVG